MNKLVSRLKEKNENAKGFTLIELLVVIAIIAILAAIAIPQYAKYRVRSYNAAAEADLNSFQTALEAYAADKTKYPTISVATVGAVGDSADVVSDALKFEAPSVPVASGDTRLVTASAKTMFGYYETSSASFYGAASKQTPGDTGYTVTSTQGRIASKSIAIGTNLAAADIPTS